jgi:hypothetical protein
MLRIQGICCGILLVMTGCAANDLRRDQDQIRGALLDLYTNQIIDNLIRASNGMPIIQIDYTNATGNVTAKETASFSDMQADTKTRMLALPAGALSFTRVLATTISGGFGAEHTNQIAVTGTPVTTANEVYDAYLEFLNLDGSLVSSCNPPPPGAAQISKKCGDRYYWVPIEYRREFFKLSLLTTAQRGKSLTAPADFYTVSLKRLIKNEQGQFANVQFLTIEIDQKIPNDTGTIRLTFDKEQVDYDVKIYEAPDHSTPSKTDTIVVVFDTTRSKMINKVGDFTKLLPLSGNVTLEHHQPKPPTTDDLLERANFQLQQIQFNQLRQPGF